MALLLWVGGEQGQGACDFQPLSQKESLSLIPPPSPNPGPGADSSHCWCVSALVVWPPVSLGSQEALLVLKNLDQHESVLLAVRKDGSSSDTYPPRR